MLPLSHVKKNRMLLKRIAELQDEIRAVRRHLVPELEHAKADFAELINYFEAKFNELEQWFASYETVDEPKLKPKPKPKVKRR